MLCKLKNIYKATTNNNIKNNMKQQIIIPPTIYKSWEAEAIAQQISLHSFGAFIKMKERQYMDEQNETSENNTPIFATSAKNKLTKYGNNFALRSLLSIPIIERKSKFARFDFEDFCSKYQSIKEGKSTNKDFFYFLDLWYKKLKDDMKEYRISKETFLKYGFNYKEATNFYFACKQEFETK